MTEGLTTERLRLRDWRDSDATAFAAMNADPEVMRHFPATLSRSESDVFLERIRADLAGRGFGWWAVEILGGAPFIGFVGLSVPRFEAHFTPCVEIGWRLAVEHQGHGYATEAARAVLDLGLGPLGLDEVVSYTPESNAASRRVMEKIGMSREEEDDFDHPLLPEGHRLRCHVLYRIHDD